jgi:rubrerythrin
LRDLNAPFALRSMLHPFPYRLQGDADSHAPVLTAQIIKDRIRDEKTAHLTYRGLAKQALTERASAVLSALAEDEQEHAAALQAFGERLVRS